MEEMHNQPKQVYQPEYKVLKTFNPHHVEYDEFEKLMLSRLYDATIYDVVDTEFSIPREADVRALTSINDIISKHGMP